MNYIYNQKYFDGKTLRQLKPKRDAIHTFKFPDGIVLGMFQGSRGEFPDLDFVIRILRHGREERPETPTHTYWVVDLILKAEKHPNEIKEIIQYYINFYDEVKPFSTIEERACHKCLTVDYILNKYPHITQGKSLSLNYVATIIELFCICEKRNSGAYMFRNLLSTVKSYLDGESDYMHVIKASLPIRR